MKIKVLITIGCIGKIFMAVAQNQNGSNYNYNIDSIEVYFLKLLNEHRMKIHKGIPILEVNPTASKACEHHNNYMANMEWVNKRPNQQKNFIGHSEDPRVVIDSSIFEYKGSDTIIPNFGTRVRFYNTTKDFSPIGEVITCNGFLSIESNYFVAKRLFKNFLSSPPHKKILESKDYCFIALNVKLKIEQMKYNTHYVFYLTAVTGGHGFKIGNTRVL